MFSTSHSQKAFTLIEVMVVVVIVAVLAGITVIAFSQASNRPLQAKARDLESWLQSLEERAELDGMPYGVVQQGSGLYAMVYYRQHWFPLTVPEPFTVDERFVLSFENEDESPPDPDSDLPPLILSPGFAEGRLVLEAPNADMRFEYAWQEEAGAFQLAGQLAGNQ